MSQAPNSKKKLNVYQIKRAELQVAMTTCCHCSTTAIDHLSDVIKMNGTGSTLEKLPLHHMKCTALINSVVFPCSERWTNCRHERKKVFAHDRWEHRCSCGKAACSLRMVFHWEVWVNLNCLFRIVPSGAGRWWGALPCPHWMPLWTLSGVWWLHWHCLWWSICYGGLT